MCMAAYKNSGFKPTKLIQAAASPYSTNRMVFTNVTLSRGLSKTDVEPSEISHINGAKAPGSPGVPQKKFCDSGQMMDEVIIK